MKIERYEIPDMIRAASEIKAATGDEMALDKLFESWKHLDENGVVLVGAFQFSLIRNLRKAGYIKGVHFRRDWTKFKLVSKRIAIFIFSNLHIIKNLIQK